MSSSSSMASGGSALMDAAGGGFGEFGSGGDGGGVDDPVVRCPYGVREMIKEWMTTPLGVDGTGRNAVAKEWDRLRPFITPKPRPGWNSRIGPLSESQPCAMLRRDETTRALRDDSPQQQQQEKQQQQQQQEEEKNDKHDKGESSRSREDGGRARSGPAGVAAGGASLARRRGGRARRSRHQTQASRERADDDWWGETGGMASGSGRGPGQQRRRGNGGSGGQEGGGGGEEQEEEEEMSSRQRYHKELAGRRGSLAMRQFDLWRNKLLGKKRQAIDDLAKAEARVVTRTLDLERARDDLRQELRAAEKVRVGAATHSDQVRAMDRVTGMLNAIRLQCCALVEAVQVWRKVKDASAKQIAEVEDTLEKGPQEAKRQKQKQLEQQRQRQQQQQQQQQGGGQAAGSESEDGGGSAGGGGGGGSGNAAGKGDDEDPAPFIWEGRNLLLDLLPHLDWLAGSAELQKWYGEDFRLRGNPFCLPVPIGERPSTPKPSTTTVVIGGVRVQQVNKRAAAEREVAEKRLAEAQLRQRNAASWWPGYKASDGELGRVRRAERALIDEVAAERRREEALLMLG
eukprot:g6615.t1